MVNNVKSSRINVFDNFKFLLITLVVIGHVCDWYINQNFYDEYNMMHKIFLFIYAFHMPAFIFISGLFSKKVIQNNNIRKIIQYLFVAILIIIVNFLCNLCLNLYNPISIFSQDNLQWFILALFGYNLLTMILKHKSHIRTLLFLIAFGCLIGYDQSITNAIPSAREIVYYPFFYLGYILNVDKILQFTKLKVVKFISSVILLTFILICIFMGDKLYYSVNFEIAAPYHNISQIIEKFGVFYRLCYYLIVTILIFSFISVIPNKKSIITKWGNRSIQVYIFHVVLNTLVAYYILNQLIAKNMFMHASIFGIVSSIVISIFLSSDIFTKVYSIILPLDIDDNV